MSETRNPSASSSRHGRQDNLAEILKCFRDDTLKSLHQLRQEIKGLRKEVEHLGDEVERIKTPRHITVVACGHTISFPNLDQGDQSMFTLPRDHQDEPYTLAPVTVGDSEGAVAGTITEEFVSSDPAVVGINATDAASGTVTFGTNGVADLRRNVSLDGLIVFSEAVSFTITPGQIIATGGGISFPGLTEDPAPAPEPASRRRK
jgi:hypothetical protein